MGHGDPRDACQLRYGASYQMAFVPMALNNVAPCGLRHSICLPKRGRIDTTALIQKFQIEAGLLGVGYELTATRVFVPEIAKCIAEIRGVRMAYKLEEPLPRASDYAGID